MSAYLFPVKKGRVTTGFYDRRPYSKPIAQRNRYHRGWDIGKGIGYAAGKIVAPEAGLLYFHLIHRSHNKKTASFEWPDGEWYIFSNFFYDNYGCCTVLVGESGKTYMFAHQNEPDFFMLAFSVFQIDSLKLNWDKQAYNNWVQALITLDKCVYVRKGARIGTIGNSGYSTADHLHMQIHADKNDYSSRIDPAELWPDMRINDNGDGPEYGTKPGVIGIVG